MNEATIGNVDPSVGGRPSIVRHFSIDGLHGYRNLSLDSDYAATILIAKNGSGKTTLLGALDAFLQGQLIRFADITFTRIKCRLMGLNEDLELTKEDVNQLIDLPVEVVQRAKSYEIEPLTLLDFLLNQYKTVSPTSHHNNPVFGKIQLRHSYSVETSNKVCDLLKYQIIRRVPHIPALLSKIREALKDIEIVYLPTFRRVELSLPKPDEAYPPSRRPGTLERLGISRNSLYSGDMQFGLSDISERLSVLNRQMALESLRGYQEISANIIDDLLDDAFSKQPTSYKERPPEDSLQLFFERMKSARRYERDFKIPNISKIYDDKAPEETADFLNYFLGKLNTVMEKTKGVEDAVRKFQENCNRYLADRDESASVPSKRKRPFQTNDDKVLNIDPRNFRITVKSVVADRNIPLDTLSSGEKQMVSLFARLFLYPPKRKIVLIDEPELSLSMNWQRRILVDILNADSCAQIVAITHSPFVFDNELEEFATMLKLKLDLSKLPPSLEEEDESNE